MQKKIMISTLCFFLLMVNLVFAGRVAVKALTLDLPKGYDGPIKSVKGPSEMLAFTKPNEGGKTNALIQFSVLDLTKAPADSPLRTAKVTNKDILLDVLKGIERRRTDFKKDDYQELTIAGLPANKIKWQGNAQGAKMKGVYYTFIYEGYLYAVSLQDIVPFADKNLLDMGKAVESMRR